MAKTAENLDAIFSEIIQTKESCTALNFIKMHPIALEKVVGEPVTKPLYKENPHSNAGLSGGASATN